MEEVEIVFCPFADDGRIILKTEIQPDSEIKTEEAGEIEN
jgi:hypothetical protein